MEKIPNVNKIEPIEIYPHLKHEYCPDQQVPELKYIDYNTQVKFKPVINGVIVEGNRSSGDYNIYNKEEVNDLIPDMSDYYNKQQIDNLIPDMPDMSDYYNKQQVDNVVNDLNNSINTKQDTLVSGTNVKTINNTSLLGSGNISISGDSDILFARVGVTTFDELQNAERTGKKIVVDEGDRIFVEGWAVAGTFADSIIYLQVGKSSGEIIYEITPANEWSIQSYNKYAYRAELDAKQNTLVSGTNIKTINNVSLLGSGNIDMNQFRVKNFNKTLNILVPPCTDDLVNTNIPKIIFNLTDDEAAEYMFRGVIAYEVFDAESGGNRINFMPVCQFTGQNSTELSIRGCVMGGNSKTARRINCWALLQHR